LSTPGVRFLPKPFLSLRSLFFSKFEKLFALTFRR
jgi:hypothetical protein